MAIRVARFNLMFSANTAAIGRALRGLDKRFSDWTANLAQNFVFLTEAFSRITGAIAEVRLEIDELGKVSDRFEISPQFLQGLQLAGELTGVAVDTVNDGLKDFQKSLGEFQLQGARADLFAAVGITDPAQVKNTEAAFRTFVNGLSEIEDASTRAAIASQVMGEAGQRMLLTLDADLINDSVDQMNEWGALTRQQIAAVEGMNDAWTKFTTQLKVQTQGTLASVAPDITALLEVAGQVFATVSRWIRDIWISFRIGVLFILETITKALTDFVKWADRFIPGSMKGITDFGDFLADSFAKQIDELQASTIEIARAAEGSVQQIGDNIARQDTGWVSDWITNQLQTAAAGQLAEDMQRFGETMRGNFVRGFGLDLITATLAMSGGQGIRAGSMQAAQFNARTAQRQQVTLLKQIAKNTDRPPIEIDERVIQ